METKKSILIISIVYLIFVISLILVYGINYDKLNKKYNEVLNELNYYHNIDTNAIHKIDSIEYNIKQKDSIIYNIKTEFINEIEIIKANNDIDAVAQFKELVESD
jgi:predicted PurR-regulated permease PerM